MVYLLSANLDGAKYVADNIGWQADTTLLTEKLSQPLVLAQRSH